MLQIVVPAMEQWDEINEQFIYSKEQVLQVEHSLVSLSKWESKWCKVFISKDDKTDEEMKDYIRCMTINQNVDPSVYSRLTRENINQITEYINRPMTATYFSNEQKGRASGEQVTSELIYYWMIAYNIPSSYEKWHLNRLLTLIKICNIKNAPPKKTSKREIMKRNAALNAARRKQLNTNG